MTTLDPTHARQLIAEANEDDAASHAVVPVCWCTGDLMVEGHDEECEADPVDTARFKARRRALDNLRPIADQLEAALTEIAEVTAQRDKLEVRRDELLQLVAKLTREMPYPAELEECRSGLRALIAEVGTLRAELQRLRVAAR